MSSANEAADAVINLSVSGRTRGSHGEFFNGLKPGRARPQVCNAKARERLHAITRQIVDKG